MYDYLRLYYYVTCHEHETVKNSESLTGMEPWPPRYRLGALTTKLQEVLGELGHQLGLAVLHTARISDVESIVCVINNEDGKFQAR